MKSIALIGVLLASAASAETITLGADECGPVKQCNDIPNDAGLSVSLYGAPGYPWFSLYVNNIEYYAAVPSGTSIDNVSMQSFVFTDPLNPAAKQSTGNYLTLLNGTFN